MQEDEGAVLLVEVLVVSQAGSRARQQALKPGLAHPEWISPKIVAVKLDQVEGIEENLIIVPPVSDPVERSHAILSAGDPFPVDNAGPRAQPGHSFDNQGETVGQIVAGATLEPNPLAVLPSDNPKAVVLNLDQPLRANGRLLG